VYPTAIKIKKTLPSQPMEPQHQTQKPVRKNHPTPKTQQNPHHPFHTKTAKITTIALTAQTIIYSSKMFINKPGHKNK
jgi:hypothetical protein